MNKLQLLHAQKVKIETEIWLQMEVDLKHGTIVRWKHRGYEQIGSVIRLVGGWWSPGVEVKNNKSGKIVQLSLVDILLNIKE